MAKTKLFVSFDFDNDRVLRDFIVGQSKLADSPFEVSDYSLKEKKPDKEWETRARNAIARSDVFLIMLGPKTRFASGVLKEVLMANELLKSGKIRSRVQVIGYKNGSRDWAVPNGGSVYAWNWTNLKKILD